MLDRLAGCGRGGRPGQQRDRDPRGAGARVRSARRRRGARAALRRAVELAEPEGYVRVFATFSARGSKRSGKRITTGSPLPRPRQPAGLVDPLSDRELDVLRLLRSDLSGPDIARELTVSLNTMRTHTKNIYMKLGVNNRREAVRRADELGLSQSPRPITTCGDVGSPHRFVRCVRAVRDPITGHLSSRWAAWFDGLSLTRATTGRPSSAVRSSTRPRCTACSRSCATSASR